MSVHFSLLTNGDIPKIIPLIQELSENKFSNKVLLQRFQEMFSQNYECIGIFYDEKLIGCMGLWYQTRHYSGKSCEYDHLYIKKKYQSMGIGKKLFDWTEKHIKKHNCETIELNTYVHNTRSHKFYYNSGFSILGFHFLKQF